MECSKVNLERLSTFDRIIATTQNSTYEMIVTSPQEGSVLVRGGTAFPRFVAARMIGSCLGGGAVKLRSLPVGFRAIFAIEESRCVVTTPVETLAVVPAARRDSKAS